MGRDGSGVPGDQMELGLAAVRSYRACTGRRGQTRTWRRSA